jgi:DNA-binding protein Fis
MSVSNEKRIENTVGKLLNNIISNKDRSGVWPKLERMVIKRALEETGGNQVRASNLLGISRNKLRKRMEKYRISKEVKIVEEGG